MTHLDTAVEIADHLATATAAGLPTGQRWWHQSLAHGAPGIALLHIELAATGLRGFQPVHYWLNIAAGAPITVGASTGLFYGAPALACALAAAATVHPRSYRAALDCLDAQIVADTFRRVEQAHARITAGRLPLMAEFDTIRGLAGLGAYLLRRDQDGGAALRAVLGYLVRLTAPITVEGRPLPGWWTLTGPTGRVDPDYPGGHGNFGVAHGICGPLSVLAHSMRRGISVVGQRDAIETICAWLDSWRIDTPAGPRWPYMITRAELEAPPSHVRHSGATRRPSWCYGTAGVARAQQLAALAIGDTDRQHLAEDALLGALTDPGQLALTADASLCHGYAGLAHISACAAADADQAAATSLRRHTDALLDQALTRLPTQPPGLLEGAAGVALACLAPAGGAPPPTRWDSAMLIA